MSIKQPKFKLEKKYSDGTTGEPELFKIKDISSDWGMNRRGFLTTSAVAAGTVLLSRCAVQTTQTAPDVKVDSCPSGAVGHRGTVYILLFSPDGSMLATGAEDGRVKFWEIPSGILKQTLRIHSKRVQNLKFTTDGKYFFSGSDDGSIIIGDGSTLKSIKGIVAHTPNVRDIGYSQPHDILVSIGGDNALMFWEVPSGKRLKNIGLSSPPWAMDVNPAGTMAATGSSEGDITLWDIPSGHMIDEFKAHNKRITNLIFGAEGTFLISSAAEDHVKIWEIPSMELLQNINFPHWSFSPDITLSPDGSRLIISNRREVGVWDVYEGKWSEMPGKTLARFHNYAFSPDNSILAGGTNSGGISLLEMPHFKLSTCLFDKAALARGKEGITYTAQDQYGRIITYYLPCGSPIPSGAVCTCNCVPGTYSAPSKATPRTTRRTGTRVCTCNKICTCVPIK
ncbi:WD40 repeat domain-containing protein [Acidobacteriota bacterium]